MVSVVLIEDDSNIRESLAALIAGTDHFSLAAAFESAEEAMTFFTENRPAERALVLTDIELPCKSGIDLCSWLKQHHPAIQIMVLSAYDDADRVFRAIKAGASGYVLKNTPAAKLIEALLDLSNGGSPMSSQIARLVVSSFQQQTPTEAQDVLSPRERDVLHWLAQGYRYQEIADKLFISIETVRTHIRNIYDKLHARNRTEALRKAGYQ